MAEKQQMQAPSGMAGLVRYSDDDRSLIKLKPQHVVAVCVFLVMLEVALYAMFPV